MPLSTVLGAQSLIKPGVCTSSTRPASPYTGQMIYETDTNKLRIWNSSAWSDITHSATLSVDYLIVGGGGSGAKGTPGTC